MAELVASVALSVAFGAVPAGASGLIECEDSDPSTWQKKSALEKQLTDAGWAVRKIEVDEHCYEVYGTTPEGDKVEAFFDPVSLEKLLVARRGEILFRSDKVPGSKEK